MDEAEFDAELLRGPAWGWMLNGVFRAIPKPPLILGGYGPPPFDVSLPSGEVRHIIEQPTPDA